jgi:EAL domain-containing protein (putative c-di-GMP-specific phosphodiesterase class I)
MTATAEHVDWHGALQQVFAEPWRVRPAYQPIIDLERRNVWGFQVLARFISPLRATPPEWLEAAQALGMRRALELRLLQAGLDAVRQLPERCRLALPMTAETLASSEVQRVLFTQVTVMRRLVIDLTAGGGAIEVDELAVAAETVRRDGGAIALLAGGSPGGLDALPELKPEVLKLGVDYVAGVDGDPGRHVVIEGLAQVVGAFRGRLLGVGVETRAQLDALTAAGIGLGQGFGLGRPVPSMAASVVGPRGAPLLSG